MNYNDLKKQNLSTDLLIFKIFKDMISSENKEQLHNKFDLIKQSVANIDDDKTAMELLKVSSLAAIVYSKKLTDETSINSNIKAKEEYDKLMLKLSKLNGDLKFSNSLETSNLFSYLLWNGYLSESHKNTFSIQNRLNVSSNYSFDIAKGRGVCLNYSDMLTDFLNTCGIDSATILNRVPSDLSVDYKPPINRSVTKPGFFQQKLIKAVSSILKDISNHACTLTLYDDKFFIYDATNLTAYKLIDKKQATPFIGSGIISLKPLFSYSMIKKDQSEKILDRLNESSNFEVPFSKEEYTSCWEKCITTLDENKALLDDFYIDAKENIDGISKNMIKVKKKTFREN